jgi:hypothetical protein
MPEESRELRAESIERRKKTPKEKRKKEKAETLSKAYLSPVPLRQAQGH